MSALKFVQKYFPDVEEIADSTKSIRINVTERDITGGRKKDPQGCAIVRACIRQDIADGAIIGIGYSYLVKGKKATRFKTSQSVAREIVSFDRSKKFEAGNDYTLSKISESSRLGVKKPGPSGPRGGHKPRLHRVHRTANIRALKNYK